MRPSSPLTTTPASSPPKPTTGNAPWRECAATWSMKSCAVLQPCPMSGSRIITSATRSPARAELANGRGLLGPGRAREEPADQHQPETAQTATHQQFGQADPADGGSRVTAGPRRGHCRPHAVLVDPPEHRTQHPATIDRCCGAPGSMWNTASAPFTPASQPAAATATADPPL